MGPVTEERAVRTGNRTLWRADGAMGRTAFEMDDLWANLAQAGAGVVKAHYALLGRWHDFGRYPDEFITVSVKEFCADLGYKKASNGGFKRESKEEATRILDALAAIEMLDIYWPFENGPVGEDEAIALSGKVWIGGWVEEGKIRVFMFSAWPWFNNPVWRQYNEAVGKIGAGLMRLDNRHDEWAILIGGYVGTLIRTRRRRPLTLRVGTILRAIGKASADTLRRKGRTQDKFERALERLREEHVIDRWEYDGTDPNWLKQCVTIILRN